MPQVTRANHPQYATIRNFRIDDLIQWATAKKLQQLFSGYPDAYILATGSLALFVGEEWTQNVALSENSKLPYLGWHSDVVAKNEHTSRVIALGENLFNLQHVPGILTPDDQDQYRFDFMCSRLGTTKEIEGPYLELEGLKLIATSSLEFSIMTPSLESGCDYDADLWLPCGTKACVEMKCCIEFGELSEDRILRSLRKARKQLPREHPGIVILKIPQAWEGEPESEAFWSLIHTVTEKYLRATTRVGLVVYYIHRFKMGVSECERVFRLHEYPNPWSPHLSLFEGGLFRHHINPQGDSIVLKGHSGQAEDLLWPLL